MRPAVDALPSLNLNPEPTKDGRPEQSERVAVGQSPAQTGGVWGAKWGHDSERTCSNMPEHDESENFGGVSLVGATGVFDASCANMTEHDDMERMGLEPTTSSLQSWHSPN